MNVNPLAIPTLILTLVNFAIGYWLQSHVRHSGLRSIILLLAVLLSLPSFAYVAFYTHLFDNFSGFHNFRAFPYTELLVAGVGFLAGHFGSYLELDSRTKLLLVMAATELFVFVPFMKPMLVPMETSKMKDRWESGVCLQSTPSTCGPASAATILANYGTMTSERELAMECFTYAGGTESWYLIRAIRRRGFKAEAVVTNTTAKMPSPSIAGVVLQGGAGHFIALLHCDAEACTFADPMIGLQQATVAELRRRYRFTSFFITVRPPATRTLRSTSR